MLRKILFISFVLLTALSLLFIGGYFIHKGNELARFNDEPSKIVEAYAASPVHFEAAKKSAQWYRGNIEFITENRETIVLENYPVNTSERDILTAGGNIKLRYLTASPRIVKKLERDEGSFWEYTIAALCFLCSALAVWSVIAVFKKKRP